MDRPILTNDHEAERHIDPTVLEHENGELKRILGIEMSRGHITSPTYSDEEVAFAMPITVRRDGLGNLTLERTS